MEITGCNAMKNRTLGSDALEMIMRDVLERLQGFAYQASLASRRDDIGNECPKEKPSARVIYVSSHFPTN
jgi:ribosome modulation factor